jgi:beta-fructofuranosidase
MMRSCQALPCRHRFARIGLLGSRFLCAAGLAFFIRGGRSLAEEAKPKGLARPIEDKTLVAWVSLADTGQRGGSALTLMEGEDFDAIVFGERKEGRWMAGSDFFRRTQGEEGQSACLAESSDPTTFIQIAIAYAGDRISIYRDGKPYASYKVDRPRAFGRDAFVLIGLRYLASMGAIGFLRGAVEEARIYDVALDEKTLAALAPGKTSSPEPPSGPEPIACWTFEDGSTADSKNTFPPGRLCGGARIDGGKLHLNGVDAYMVSQIPDDEDQAVFYFPRRRDTGRMWDTWLYHHQGTY